MDLNVEICPGQAADVLTQQILATAVGQYGVEMIEQVTVLAAQIDEAAGCADGVGGHRHALENEVGTFRKQHAILEGTRFAFVGIADDDALMAGLEQAFAPGPHVRGIEAIARRPRPSGKQCFAGCEVGVEQDVGAPDVVLDPEIGRRPVGQRHLVANQLGDFVDTLQVQAGNRVVIDQHARPLIAQAGAGRLADADQAVFGNLAALDPQVAAQALHKRPVALHPVGDVVGKQHPVFAARLGVNEGIEAGNALDLGARHAQHGLHAVDGFRRDPVAGLLNFAQDLQHAGRIASISVDHPVDNTGDRFGMHFIESHDNLLKIAHDMKRLAPKHFDLLSEVNIRVFVTQPKSGMCNNGAASQHTQSTTNR